jgi:hypothetical protein
MTIELTDIDKLFSDPELIAMAKGQIPLPGNSVTAYCPRCHWGGSYDKTREVFYCEFCQKEFENKKSTKNIPKTDQNLPGIRST